MASNCPFWKAGKCESPSAVSIHPCSYDGTDYDKCAVHQFAMAKEAGASTTEALRASGVPLHGITTVVSNASSTVAKAIGAGRPEDIKLVSDFSQSVGNAVRAALKSVSLSAGHDVLSASRETIRGQWEKILREHPKALDLNQADLHDHVFPFMSFVESTLEGANLEKSVLYMTKFERAHLCKARFAATSMFQAYFYDSDMRGVSFKDATIYTAQFYNSDLSNACFDNVTFYGPMVKPRTNFAGASFVGAKLVADAQGGYGMASGFLSLLSPAQREQIKKVGAGGDGGAKCFVATACYGSALSPEVMELRKFRDRFLLSVGLGRWFVDAYYRSSPRFASLLAERPGVRSAVRRLLVHPCVILARFWNQWPVRTEKAKTSGAPNKTPEDTSLRADPQR
jgi:uncharacterized protein YjbI with pentapeptide repeats